MPRGFRLFFAAAVGWLTLSSSYTVYAQPNERKEQTQPSQHQISPPLSASPTSSAKSEPAPSKACIESEHGQLSCEAIAAQAAYDQARAADRQTWIGIAGVIGVVVSLIFSARATSAAFKAAREAEKGSQASLDAVAETREANRIAKLSQRPWLTFDIKIINYHEHGNDLIVPFETTVTNYSSFPAHNVKVFGVGYIHPGGITTEFIESCRSEVISGLDKIERSENGHVVFPNTPFVINDVLTIYNPFDPTIERSHTSYIAVGIRYAFEGGIGETSGGFMVYNIETVRPITVHSHPCSGVAT